MMTGKRDGSADSREPRRSFGVTALSLALLVALALAGASDARAKVKSKSRPKPPTSTRAAIPTTTTPTATTPPTPTRACGARTIPAEPGDTPAMSIDIDHDGQDDLVVINWSKQQFRVAFSGGPETAFPLPPFGGGLASAALLRAPSRMGLFAVSVTISSSGFAGTGGAVFSRSRCTVAAVTLDGAPLILSNQRSKSSRQLDTTDLRCVAGNLVLAHLSVDQFATIFKLDERSAQLSGNTLTADTATSQNSAAAIALPGEACLSESTPLANP